MEAENDEDMLFFKSLIPQVKKAKDPFTLKLKIMNTIRDHLDAEMYTLSDDLHL